MPRQNWWLPGLIVILFMLGGALLAVACITPRQNVSTIPAAVGTRPPASSPATASPPAPVQSAAPGIPVSIKIPAIDVNAPLMQLGLNSDRTIEVPPLANPNLAGWYKYGASPGQKGAAVIVGHIDSTAGASVFFKLRDLHTGDQVFVTLNNGHTATFAVDGLQQVPKTNFPTTSVYGPVSYAALRLVTCGGVFDPATGSYLSDVIVYSHLVQ